MEKVRSLRPYRYWCHFHAEMPKLDPPESYDTGMMVTRPFKICELSDVKDMGQAIANALAQAKKTDVVHVTIFGWTALDEPTRIELPKV